MDVLSIIGALLTGAGLLTAGRTANWKAMTLSTAGSLFLLGDNIVTHNELWTWISAAAVVFSALAAISYYRRDRKTGGAR